MNPYTAPDVDLPASEPRVRVTELRRIDAFSVAKPMGVLYGGIGLLIGGLYGAMMMLVGIAGAAGGEPEALVIVFVGLLMIVALPIFYGLIGALFAAIAALIYNLGARWLGGIRFELHDV